MPSFKIDENLPAEATKLLQEAGYDALSVHDQEMVGSTDENLAEVCQKERRAMVTLDLDFADILAYPPENHFGLIVLRLVRQEKTHVLEVLANVLPKFDDEKLVGKLWIVTERTLRIRS